MEHPPRQQKFGQGRQGCIRPIFHMAHTDLENLVYFSPMTDTSTQVSGRVWDRQGAITMGGPFSAAALSLRRPRTSAQYGV